MRPTRSTCAIALSLVLLCQASADAQPRKFEPPTARQREIAGRRLLVDARALVQQGRLDAAVGTLRRSLLYAPNEARSHDLLARVLTKLGRDEEAQAHRALADAIAPPPTPMPEEPLFADSEGLLVVLVPPPDTSEPLDRVANDWPTGIAAQTLEGRLQTRLPGAVVLHANPLTVGEARALLTTNSPGAVLSLRVDRLYCRDTVKDGPYAVAWLRVAGETPGDPSEGPDEVREVVFDPRLPGGCRAEALARAVERVLRYRNVRRTIDAHTGAPHALAWSNAAIRALFPGLGERIKVALDRGRRQISTGHVAAAGETLRAAAVIDPGDEVVHAYLHEIDATLAMASEIAARHDPEREREEDRGVLDPRFSPAQRAAAEEQLAEARRERDSLLAAVAALGDDIGATSTDALARLHRGEILDPDAFGPRTALMRAGGEVEARVAYTPDGHEIARWFVPAGGGPALIREEDVSGDGRPDRWIVFRDGLRHEVWEAERGFGDPDIHYTYAPRGEKLERVELGTTANGRPDRVLRYDAGVLTSEAYDHDRDGVPERVDRFDSYGYVTTRDEDLDGDGEFDMRSTYRAGRLVEREVRMLEFAPDDS